MRSGWGKTLQAGVILKTRLNQGVAKKVLIIAPKAATKQWQDELFMKFAIEAPIIDSNFRTYRNGRTEPAGQPAWDITLGIASQQWLVRNTEQFLQTCGDYDLIICDEAHRARFRDVDDDTRRQPNQYLRMMYRLCRQTRELLLLTATPMQMNEMELWALFGLLEPEGWNEYEYRRFYQDAAPDIPEWKFRRDLWRKSNPTGRASGILNSDNGRLRRLHASGPRHNEPDHSRDGRLGTRREADESSHPSTPPAIPGTGIVGRPNTQSAGQGHRDHDDHGREGAVRRNNRSGADVLRRPRHKPAVLGIHQDHIPEEVRFFNVRLRPDPQERG